MKTKLRLLILMPAFVLIFITNGKAQSDRMLNFNSTKSDYVDCGAFTQLDNISQFTIESWVYFTAAPSSWGTICSRSIGNAGNQSGGGTNDKRIEIQVDPSMTLYAIVSNGNWAYGLTNTTLTLNTWYHIAVVFNGTLIGDANWLKIYLNGAPASMSFNGTNLIPATAPTATGATGGFGNFYLGTENVLGVLSVWFDGNIDDFHVWNTALSQSQLIANMGTDVSGSAGILASYNFNQGIGGHNGTLHSFTLNGNNSNWLNAPSVVAPIAPVAIAATNITLNSFSANWNPLATAIGYYLDVATDAAFTSMVVGYNNLSVSNVTTYSVTGLSASTPYYYRIRAVNAGGTSPNSNVINPTTLTPTPILTKSGTLNPFSTTQGTASTAQTFTVSGSNLTANAIVNPPSGYEVSTDGTTYSASLNLTRSGGTLTGQPVTIYVRIAASTPVGFPAGNISIASTGATTQNVAITGSVIAPPPALTVTGTLNPFSTTQGTASTAQTFTVSGSSLTANAIVNPPSGYEVSTDGTTYSTNLNLTRSGGTLSGQPVTIYVRIDASTPVGSPAGNISIGSIGVTTQNVAITGTVTAPTSVLTETGTLNPFSTTQGTASTAQTFTVSGSNLTANATVTPPAGYEVSTDGTTYSASLNLTQ